MKTPKPLRTGKPVSKREMIEVRKHSNAVALVKLYLDAGHRPRTLTQKANLLFLRKFIEAIRPEFQPIIKEKFVELETRKEFNYEGISHIFMQTRRHNPEFFKTDEMQKKVAFGLLTNFGVPYQRGGKTRFSSTQNLYGIGIPKKKK